MRKPLLAVFLAVASSGLAGCCCNSPCQPCSAPPRAPCAYIYNRGPSVSWPTTPCTAPKLTAPPSIAITPARGSFRLPEMGAPSYAPATVVRPSIATPPPAAVASRTFTQAPAPAAVIAQPAPMPVSRPSSGSAASAIVAPVPSAAKGEECEDCSDGHCGVPPPR